MTGTQLKLTGLARASSAHRPHPLFVDFIRNARSFSSLSPNKATNSAGGFCECGCGGTAPIRIRNHKSRGLIKGEHCRFIRPHQQFVARFTIKKERPWQDRFWKRIEKTESCWLWVGKKDKDGYGIISIRKRGKGNFRAHRLSWELEHGLIPTGLVIRHSCDNPPCVNPKHLLIGTPQDNTNDALERGLILRGTQIKNSKLNNEKVRQIRRLRKEGVDTAIIAKKFNVSAPLISYICLRYIWKHVEDL